MSYKEKLAFLALRKASLELQLTIIKQNIKSIEEEVEERKVKDGRLYQKRQRAIHDL